MRRRGRNVSQFLPRRRCLRLLLLLILSADPRSVDITEKEAEVEPDKRERKRRRRKPWEKGDSVDRTPRVELTWHRMVTSEILRSKDDFEVLGLPKPKRWGPKHAMPTEELLHAAQRRRIFAIRTDHYDGSTVEAGYYATQAHLKVHAALNRLMHHPAIIEDWAGVRPSPRDQG
mmetsp:Transcript_3066/g.6007  ORF Transcript_3066/g.6007 Transcript_3066/m.6007 type:complete len:174 (-) Transcript_3066:199-720(-)